MVAWQATSASIAARFTGVAIVLPFICIALGGPVLAATLIYPVWSVARLLGVLATPVLLGPRRSTKWMLTACLGAAAVIMTINAVGSQILGSAMGFAFVLTGAMLGFLVGVRGVCFMDLVSDALHSTEHGRLFVFRRIASCVVVVAVAGVDMLIFGVHAGSSAHIRLLWFGVLAMVISTVCGALIGAKAMGEHESATTPARTTVRASLHTGASQVRRHGWFRRYLVVQIVFVTTSLGVVFYSAHGASLYGGSAVSLHLILAFSALGLLAFGVAWLPIKHRVTVRGMYSFAAALSVLAAGLCVFADRWARADAEWLYGVIIALAAVVTLAIGSTQRVWLLRQMTEHRLIVISYSNLLIGVAAALIAAGLGFLAHLHGVIWPVYCVLVLSLLALGTIGWAPNLRVVDRPLPATVRPAADATGG